MAANGWIKLMGKPQPVKGSKRLVKVVDRSPSSPSVDARIAFKEEAAALLLGSELCGWQLVVTTVASRLPNSNTQLDATAFEASLHSYLEAWQMLSKLRKGRFLSNPSVLCAERPISVLLFDRSAFHNPLRDDDKSIMVVVAAVFDKLVVDNSTQEEVEHLVTLLLSEYDETSSRKLN
ncbi:hypothetical protein SELMODRAFT_429592 [Selaginella moellendorffii]|uniref:Uncharacterized protein n=1 Tax=Selaginella moellendorffii TaxID=88036 RepID=D8T6P2_SELML|nr:hypothetical protein SELMODRAFT_429592 [Selaginella moellendorffii]